MGSVTFGVQASPTSQEQWTDEARRAEDLGFTFFCLGDHPGLRPSPFPALGAAAAVTSTIRLGPYVLNAGLKHPIDLATDVAALDILSGGRAVLGLGAGHTPAEWQMRSMQRPSPARRIEHLIAVADSTQALLNGETVTTGQTPSLSEAGLDPMLVRPDIPLLIGGNNRKLLTYASRKADIIGLTGLGRTLEGGHLHEARWSESQLEETFSLISEASAGRAPERQALVQWAEITDNPKAIADQVSQDLKVSFDHVMASPFILLGTASEIADRIVHNRDRWGITSYVVRERSVQDIGRVIELIN